MNGDLIKSGPGVLARRVAGPWKAPFWFPLLLWLLPGLITAQVLISFRTYTNTEGRKIDAEVLWVKDGKVALRTMDGQSYAYPLDKLSPEDQRFLKSHEKRTFFSSSFWESKDQLVSKFGFNGGLQRIMFFWIGVSMVAGGSLCILFFAFQENVWWGLASMIIPFAMLAFVSQYWHDVKKPFFWHMAGWVLILATIKMSG